jgi:hypothetical protein
MKDNAATAYFKMTTTYISKHKVKKLHMMMIFSALLYIHDEIIVDGDIAKYFNHLSIHLHFGVQGEENYCRCYVVQLLICF